MIGITVAIKVSFPKTYDGNVKTIIEANHKKIQTVDTTPRIEAAKDFEIYHVNHDIAEEVEVIGISCCPKIM